MALINAYCSVAELRDHLRDEGATMPTSLLERAINTASREIEERTGRQFWQEAAVAERTYYPATSSIAFVDDISTRTGLIVKTGTDGVTFPTTLASTDYILEPRNAGVVGAGSTANAYAFHTIKVFGSRFTVDPERPTLAVTARFGWSEVPPKINEACVLMAASLFKMKDAPFGIAGVNDFGPVRIARINPYVEGLLAGFSLGGFA